MFILAGHITAEQLTKFILYSEWLIYSTWWVGDNVSSLMQSVGASEKVFHLMDLEPSSQLIAKGLYCFTFLLLKCVSFFFLFIQQYAYLLVKQMDFLCAFIHVAT